MSTARPPEQHSFGAFNTTPQHRWFFTIWPDASAIDRLIQLSARLALEKIMPGKPVDADRLHVTLHHLGDFADQTPPNLLPTASLAAATMKMEPFEVTFDRIGGTRGQFLLRPSEPLKKLMEFQKNLKTAMLKAGLRRRINPACNPHMTLSYDFSEAPEHRIDPISWKASNFVLIESLLGKHEYIERGRWNAQP